MSLQSIEAVFQRIRETTHWDISAELLWGFFFSDPSASKLETLAIQLGEHGYHRVDVYPADDQSTFFLHLERRAHMGPADLDACEEELREIASRCNSATYDGWDVGPTDPSQIGQQLWWNYLADYDGKPGLTRLDLALKSKCPIGALSTLTIVKLSYEVGADGLPDPTELELLHSIEDDLVNNLKSSSYALHVGSFLNEGILSIFIHLPAQNALSDTIEQFCTKRCAGRAPIVKIKEDAEWSAYLNFLYPNQATIDFYRAELEGLGANQY